MQNLSSGFVELSCAVVITTRKTNEKLMTRILHKFSKTGTWYHGALCVMRHDTGDIMRQEVHEREEVGKFQAD